MATSDQVSPSPQSSDMTQDGSRGQGWLKWYNAEKGFGFIARKSQPDLFFGRSAMECAIPYDDEPLSFEIGKDREGRDVALRVRRQGVAASGDIVEWRVDPGTHQGEGIIAPYLVGQPISFSGSDLVRMYSPKGKQVWPRPWYGANYLKVTLQDGTERAVEVKLDTRYPLQRFAWLGVEEQMIEDLRQRVLDENWDYRTSPSGKRNEILYNYIHFTFARLMEEDRGRAPAERKIRIREDLKDHTPLAVFNTGLVDKRYESVYALFEPNDRGRSPRWKFMAFCIPGEDAGKLLSMYFNPLPMPARYFTSTSELLYDPDAPLHPDYRHILTEDRERLPKELLQRVEGMDQVRAEKALKMYLDQAIELARKRARWNFKTAIPHYFPTLKRLDFLLPLCLLDDKTVNVALAVQRTETGYLGNTILPLDWAYKSARLVCRPDSDWLAPDRIDSASDPVTEDSDVGAPAV